MNFSARNLEAQATDDPLAGNGYLQVLNRKLLHKWNQKYKRKLVFSERGLSSATASRASDWQVSGKAGARYLLKLNTVIIIYELGHQGRGRLTIRDLTVALR